MLYTAAGNSRQPSWLKLSDQVVDPSVNNSCKKVTCEVTPGKLSTTGVTNLPPRHQAVLRELYAGMSRGRFVARTFQRLSDSTGIGYNTARRACARLETLGVLRKIRRGGGFAGAQNIGQANAWIVTHLADDLVAHFDTLPKRATKVGNKEKHQALPDVSLLNQKTKHQTRETAGDKSPRSKATSTSTAKSDLQESDFGERQVPVKPPLPVDDADLNAYLSFATAFMAGTCTLKVRRAFFTACRRSGVDKAALLPAYRAHTAHCLRRGFGLKRPDTFLLHESYLDEWPVVAEPAAPKGPSAAEREAVHQANLERLIAQNAADREADESCPADPERVKAIIRGIAASKTPQEVRRTPSRVAVAAMTAPKPVAAPIAEALEVYVARAVAIGISEDIARRSWEGNRVKA